MRRLVILGRWSDRCGNETARNGLRACTDTVRAVGSRDSGDPHRQGPHNLQAPAQTNTATSNTMRACEVRLGAE